MNRIVYNKDGERGTTGRCGYAVHIRGGAPRHLKVYETKEACIDKYTAVFAWANKFAGASYIGRVYYVGFSPSLSVYQHGEADRNSFSPGGRRVDWMELPREARIRLLCEYADLWGVGFDHNDGVALRWFKDRSKED